jgi:4-diphosphocytidyl-2-C-methyl-D-erythritol kinase
MLKIKAPAKLNLTLEVLSRRPDGYHEIWSIVQAIGLTDFITLEESSGVTINCDMPGWSAGRSLVSKALNLVRESCGLERGVKFDINKNIPLLSGLGGDSSDAAAVLEGLNEFWKLDLTLEQLRHFAADLGSDVFFFLTGGTAFAGGRGERIKSLPALPRMWAVVVVPDLPRETGKTVKMYAALEPSHFTDGRITQKFVDMLAVGTELDDSLLFNTFENIAFADSDLRAYVEHLEKLGAPHVHLCGSGFSLFTLFKDKSSAEELYTCCRDQQMEVYLAETL